MAGQAPVRPVVDGRAPSFSLGQLTAADHARSHELLDGKMTPTYSYDLLIYALRN